MNRCNQILLTDSHIMTVLRGAGTMKPPRPSTASLTRDENGRKPLGRINMNRPSTASSTRRPREKKQQAYRRLGALYNMNSSSNFPKTRGGIIKRPTTAPAKRRKAKKLKSMELQEKEKHRYSYWRHDTSILTKTTMLNNVNPSPRDPKADERSRRRKLHEASWKVGYGNKLGSSRSGPPKVEVDAHTGEVRVLPPEAKGWPLDSSMRNPWGPRPGSDPWQPPLDSVPPGDWPKGEYDQPSPRGMHHPWSPPRHGSDIREPMLGFPGNVRSLGQRKSVLAKTTPLEYLRMKEQQQKTRPWSAAPSPSRHQRADDAEYDDLDAEVARLQREKTGKSTRGRPTTAAPRRGGGSRVSSGSKSKVQFMNSVRAANNSTADSPMRGRLRPQSAVAGTRRKGKMTRAQSATGLRKASPGGGRMSPGNRMSPGGGNTTPSRRRPETAGPSTRKRSGTSSSPSISSSRGRRGGTSGKGTTYSTPNLSNRLQQNKQKIRPHTASAAMSPMRSPYGGSGGALTLSPGGTTKRNRPHTAQAGGYKRGIRRSVNGQPKYMRPTTATRTKQLYRTGQWPSGRWKMEKASHFVPMTTEERKKQFHVKHKKQSRQHAVEDPDVVSSSSEEEADDPLVAADEDEAVAEDARKQVNRARRLREAQMRKRPMVAGQRKPRRRFEQKALAEFTVLRSAPLKKHHVHEVLGKKLAERNRRCEQRETATAWLLGHTKFKQMTLARFWKQFKPLAVENIEATQLLQRLKQSAANGGDTSVVHGRDDDYDGEDEDDSSIHVPASGQSQPGAFPVGVHVVDKTPWLNEHSNFSFMWITRPQFIHHMRILMSLNETHNNLRALNRLFSSFDVDVEDKMNAREFCVVLAILREERKRSVWAGKQDVNPVFEEARTKYRKEPKNRRGQRVMGRVNHL